MGKDNFRSLTNGCQYLRTWKKWSERASDSQGDCSKFSANIEESKKGWENVKKAYKIKNDTWWHKVNFEIWERRQENAQSMNQRLFSNIFTGSLIIHIYC